MSPFKFGGANGCLSDADTGLVLMGHRYYDSRQGRFLSQDPAQAGGNWYEYAGNSPTNHVDPSGLYLENPEPMTDQTQGAVMFEQAFYGDQSGLSSFFDAEEQSEERGSAEYAASVEVNKAIITGGAGFSDFIKGLLEKISETNAGGNLLAQFLWSGDLLKITEYDNPADDGFVPYPVKGQDGAFLNYYNTILWDPSAIIVGSTTNGYAVIPQDVGLVHEMGHDITYGESDGNIKDMAPDPDPCGIYGLQNTCPVQM